MSGKNYNAGKKNEKASYAPMREKGFYKPNSGKSKKDRANIKAAYLMFGKEIKSTAYDLIDDKHRPILNDPRKILAQLQKGDFILYELSLIHI